MVSRGATVAVAALVALLATTAHARLYARIADGLPIYDEFGSLKEYMIFAEENAPLTPVPKLEILNTELAEDRDVRQKMVEIPHTPIGSPQFNRYKLRNALTVTKSASTTIDVFRSISRTPHFEKRSFMTWFVRSAPFGALSAVGPKQFYADDQSFFPLDGLRFRTAGRYEVVFNVSMITGTNFHFNRTIFVQRQPNSVIHATTVAGYNGSVFFPPPSAQLVDFTGAKVRTSTPTIEYVLEALPWLASIRGTLIQKADATGFATFTNMIPTLPGAYTFRLRAYLSDGSTLTTPSQQVIVARALPTRIIVRQSITGIARFQFFTQPIFSIEDSAGPSQDPRMNMSLSIAQNNPDFSYEGYNTIATLSGTTAVFPVNYRYTFSELSIDLPGNYEIRASLLLPTGATLSRAISLRINNPPTFEVVDTMVVNNPGIISLHGERPAVDRVVIMLALDEECSSPSSDQVVWPADENDGIFNITIVPFNAQPSYVCMAIPSHPNFAPLIQRYLPQYDELFPLVFTFSVQGVDECKPLSATAAAQYRSAGWETAAALRSYGCRLTPPVAGTIPACACPRPLTCDTLTHEKFNPPGLDIGQCVCCETWVLAVAGTITGLFFALVILVIFVYV
uniref:Uncharacterized protein n=1 Tax=Neobodo designis TaxID=312471 RepID=A0A7S1QJN2_NEODS|mmetsp:Transcript_47077/g.145165  ORF Transcript_47077/g.145165 Transcript_47077/m.145165 type:complete len:623 (+) Transcript_47077:138-2006(+)|eukprot:CAMPEP_0174830158 /NCGR_PEP_ID=MMETSP1114-20130205/2367_1 /TAXON_ID=312471 /ORGANISM="Neobodo designis, Strain CCAP 1951/1" /LENGTH=622 /DNA_ID=CAMNT_0016063945 /DNA_START=136 /DNA_END=2004 /DNA_ORIENTATION=+